MTDPIRIGTRGSRLALAQAHWFADALRELGQQAELEIIKTSGDRFVDRPLRDIGGKGLFVKEIEQALLDGTIDCAVHSMKDLPAELAPGLVLAAVPRREHAHDVVISEDGRALSNLPEGARVGTSSTRRKAFCLHARPDLDIVELRGNVDTRLRKLGTGEVDAILLAAAGLNRLGLEPAGLHALEPPGFLPAIGQGALALESRDDHVASILTALDHSATNDATRAERAVLAALGGSCHTPIAAHAICDGEALSLHAAIAAPDGSRIVRAQGESSRPAGEQLGRDLAAELLADGGSEILAALGQA